MAHKSIVASVQLSASSKETSSKVDYDIVRSGNINKLTISNYEDNKLQNSLLKYVVKKGGKKTTYVYNGDTYDKVSGYSEDFNVNYEELKKGKIKKVSKNKYIITKKSYDAYNMLYNKEVISKEDTDSTIEVTVVIDSKNDFVKEISYEIDDMDNGNMKYKLKLENRDINNHNSIKLPF